MDKPERIEALKQEISKQSGRDIDLEVGIIDQSASDDDMIDLGCIHMDVTLKIKREECACALHLLERK